jgi:uncharacterized protein with PQ loop repeat
MSIQTLVAGAVATTFTVSMQLPQIYHTIKIKKAEDISMSHLILCIFNHITWLIYAIIDNINIPLIICDVICIILTTVLICLKRYYDRINIV